jgi:hypothetical protein
LDSKIGAISADRSPSYGGSGQDEPPDAYSLARMTFLSSG